jgi:hypothetical protein
MLGASDDLDEIVRGEAKKKINARRVATGVRMGAAEAREATVRMRPNHSWRSRSGAFGPGVALVHA